MEDNATMTAMLLRAIWRGILFDTARQEWMPLDGAHSGVPTNIENLRSEQETDRARKRAILDPSGEHIPVEYEHLDLMVQKGLAEERQHNGVSWVILTHEGELRRLELSSFNLAAWRKNNAHRICCDQAIPNGCVCYFSTVCPTHGQVCVGSHD